MASTTGQRSSRSAKSPARGRRNDYVDAAARVFFRRGYDSATVGDIAEELDVTKAALYYYFASKEELLYEIIREMHVINLRNLESAETHTGPAQARLWNYFVGHVRVNLNFFEKSTVVYRDLDHLSADRRREVVALRDKTQQYVRDLLSEAVAEGTACTLADLNLASIAMFTTANAFHNWYHPGGQLNASEASRRMADYVVAGISCTGESDRSCPRHNPPALA
ncbi:TetR/AcrR family transcriptional regulator [Gordonia terrae]